MTTIVLSQPNLKLGLMSISQIDFIIQTSDIEAMEKHHWDLPKKLEYSIKHRFNRYVFKYIDNIINHGCNDNPFKYLELIGMYDNKELIDHIIKVRVGLVIYCLLGAIKADRVDSIDIMIKKASSDGSETSNSRFIVAEYSEKFACIEGSIKVLTHLFEKYGICEPSDKLMELAFEHKNIQVLKYLESVCPQNVVDHMTKIGICSSNLAEKGLIKTFDLSSD